MEITIRNGQTCRIDDQDADLGLFRWHPAGGKRKGGSYLARAAEVDGHKATIYLHRVIAWRMGLVKDLGVTKGQQGRWVSSIDHINGDKLDNRRSNLRLLTRAEQMTNHNDGLRSTNASGYRGVSYISKQGQWMAYANENGKTKSLGSYATAEEANEARKAWDAGAWAPSAPIQRPCACGCGELVTSSKGAKPRLYVDPSHGRRTRWCQRWVVERGERPTEAQLCTCGCGEETPLNPRTGLPCMYVDRFVHAQRAHRAKKRLAKADA